MFLHIGTFLPRNYVMQDDSGLSISKGYRVRGKVGQQGKEGHPKLLKIETTSFMDNPCFHSTRDHPETWLPLRGREGGSKNGLLG